MLKASQEPPMLSLEVASIAESTQRWWVAHTRSRFEKAFARDLLSRGIGYFLPLVEKTRLIHGRKRRVFLPVFPSYVFFCGDEQARVKALRTNRLCQTLEVADQDTLVRQLHSIERALAHGAGLDLYPGLVPGRRYTVTSGPFRGIEGKLIRTNGQTHVVLEISTLGLGASLEIEADLLEPVGASGSV